MCICLSVWGGGYGNGMSICVWPQPGTVLDIYLHGRLDRYHSLFIGWDTQQSTRRAIS